jgi:hypothetical protein
MTVVRREWPGADKLAQAPGPDQYAPPDRRPPEKLADVEHIAALRQQRSESGPAADNLDALIRRVASASIEEIDRVVHELESVRDILRNEGDRVSREIAGYASLSHASMTAMKVIADSVAQWKSGAGKPPRG